MWRKMMLNPTLMKATMEVWPIKCGFENDINDLMRIMQQLEGR